MIEERYVVLKGRRCPCGRAITDQQLEEDGTPMYWGIHGQADWNNTRFVAVCRVCAGKTLVDCGIRRPRRRPRKVAITS